MSELDLPPERMRAMGYRVVDHLVERIARLDSGPPWRGATREEMRRRLSPADLDTPAAFDALLEELFQQVLPFGVSTDHPRFFAFIPSCPTWPGILGDLVAAGSGIYPGTWLGSAGYSALELEVLAWFKDWIGYPREAAGLLMSGGSMANLAALVAAREARLGREPGAGVIYASAEAHSSVIRAARILGFPDVHIRVLEPDADDRLAPPALAAAIAEDRARGLRPFFVAAAAGSTSTGAVDPLEELAAVCEGEGLWLHVDAAYGGFAVLSAAGRAVMAGIERADSVTLDPHKWLYQPFEAGCLLVRRGRELVDAFRVAGTYLQDTALAESAAPDDGEVNFGDRGPQLTRSARALKIWLSVRFHGLDRIRKAIEAAMALAERAEVRIRASGDLELVTPARLGVVCFRSGRGEAEDAARIRRLLESGTGMVSSTRIRGEYVMRLCILNHRSRWEDVEAVLSDLERPVP
ncbi:MAG TPA: aminotransferase class V-fold PLP-dependent enzyme [Longimicrobiales bacterium]|nr:aminotransferase class V-fold PLP-dependent enzyme [Longimicrobiales bacterium]